jgi:hypothetical protein
MVTISIAAAAFAAIGATMPKGFKAQGRSDGKGGYLVTLDRNVVDRSRRFPFCFLQRKPARTSSTKPIGSVL